MAVVAAWCWSGPARAATASVTIGGTPAASVLAAKYYNFQPSATSPQGRKLTFSIANKPVWAGFDVNYGRLYGSPIPANVGTYGNIVISVSDGQSSARLAAFSVTVQPMQDPGPVISGTPPPIAIAGKPYAFQPSVRNDYGLRISFAINNKPRWLTLDSATGFLMGTPGSADVGTYPRIVETVSDGYKGDSLDAFDLTVVALPPRPPAPAPPAPAGAVALQWEPPTVNTDSSPLTDLAGYHVYYGASPQSLQARITIASPGVATYVVDNLAPGTWFFAVAAYNSDGVEGELSDVIGKVMY